MVGVLEFSPALEASIGSWPCVAFSAAAADVGLRVGIGTGDENERRGVLACEMSSISERAWKVDDMIYSLLAPRSLLVPAACCKQSKILAKKGQSEKD